MKHHPATLTLIVAAALFTALPSLSLAEERFGPWAYYAPYYFPPQMVYAGRLFSPQDFLPRYETPNPPQPSNAAPPGMIADQRCPTKVRGRTMHTAVTAPRNSGLGRPSLSAPYRPSPRPEREYGSSTPSVRPHEPAARPSALPPATEKSINRNLPAATPTPQLSTPGEPSKRYQPPQQPAPPAQHESTQRPAPVYQLPERPLTQQVTPKIPDNAFEQVNKPSRRVESSEIPSSTSPATVRQSVPSVPADNTMTAPAGDQQPYAGSPSKKPWTWGRKPSGAALPREQVAPTSSRPHDTDL